MSKNGTITGIMQNNQNAHIGDEYAVPSFIDTNGNVWKLNITLLSLLDLKEQCDIDIDHLIENGDTQEADRVKNQTISEFFSDIDAVARACFVVSGAYKSPGMTKEKFYGAMNAVAIKSARDALAKALIDFFTLTAPEKAKKITVCQEVIDAARAEIVEYLNKVDAKQTAKTAFTEALKTTQSQSSPLVLRQE